MKTYTVDRFEGETAVLLLSNDETVVNHVPKDQLPEGIQESDVVEIQFDQNGLIKEALIKREETASRKKKAISLLEKLKNKK